MRDELEDVEPGDALRVEQPRGVRLRLLQDRGEDVARLHFLALRALDVQHGGLQHAAERRGLFGLALVAALQLLDRLVEIRDSGRAAARGRSAPQAVRIRSPSVSCASANSRCSSVR